MACYGDSFLLLLWSRGMWVGSGTVNSDAEMEDVAALHVTNGNTAPIADNNRRIVGSSILCRSVQQISGESEYS
jgi:hypothetical protein